MRAGFEPKPKEPSRIRAHRLNRSATTAITLPALRKFKCHDLTKLHRTNWLSGETTTTRAVPISGGQREDMRLAVCAKDMITATDTFAVI